MPTPEAILQASRTWVEAFVVRHGICPFARLPVSEGRVHYALCLADDLESWLKAAANECARLDRSPEVETSLLILPALRDDFLDYLDALDVCEQLLIDSGYEGIYQVASFHPRYQFHGNEYDDPANFTNRSPYPMLHFIREASIDQALERYPDPEGIPGRNQDFMRQRTAADWQAELDQYSQDPAE